MVAIAPSSELDTSVTDQHFAQELALEDKIIAMVDNDELIHEINLQRVQREAEVMECVGGAID